MPTPHRSLKQKLFLYLNSSACGGPTYTILVINSFIPNKGPGLASRCKVHLLIHHQKKDKISIGLKTRARFSPYGNLGFNFLF